MSSTGIGIGLISSTTIIVVFIMLERGYPWWQIMLVIILSILLAPTERS